MNKERFVRWQGLTIVEMGKTTGLFLGILFATLGFSVAQLIDPNLTLHCESKLVVVLGCFFLLVDVVVFLLLVLNRQKDLRFTTKLVRLRETEPGSREVSRLETEVAELGTRTHGLFQAGLIVFVVAQFLIVLGFTMHIL